MDIQKRLDELAALKDNWDSYGARKINLDVIKEIPDLINLLKTDPYIFPNNKGGITLEYGWKIDGRNVEIDINPKNFSSDFFYEVREDDYYTSDEIQINDDIIAPDFDKFSKGADFGD